MPPRVWVAEPHEAETVARLLVGFDGSDGGRDALELARVLAGATGAAALVVTVLPYGPMPITYSLLGEEDDAPAAAAPAAIGDDALEATLAVPNRLGLHARPAGRFVSTVATFDATVQVENVTRGTGPADGRSLGHAGARERRHQVHEIGLRPALAGRRLAFAR